MKRKTYLAPESFLISEATEKGFMITSGGDEYHNGGGGVYGDYDINDNDFVF